MNKVVGLIAAASLLIAAPAFASVDLTLEGGSVAVNQGQSFVEPGYSAYSTVDGDITGSVAVDAVDTSKAGKFTIGYSVTDSNSDSAVAFRSVTVIAGAGTQPYCSGPTAPGWRMDLADGGCGGAKMHIIAPGTLGCGYWNTQGCVVKE